MFPATIRTLIPVAILGVTLCGYRVVNSWSQAAPELPDQPALITAKQDAPWVATDEQVMAVLARVVPGKTNVVSNTWLHALRLWGKEAEFQSIDAPSGKQMLSFFLEDSSFQKWTAAGTPPLFEIRNGRLQARSYDEDFANRTSSSYHADDVLATFGECRLPLTTIIQTRNGQGTIADLMDGAMQRFHLATHEYEWSIISYARYWFPRKSWQNQFGQKITLEDLIDELMAHPPEQGPCLGLHRLEAAVVLLGADDNLTQSGLTQAGNGGLSKRQRARLTGYLTAVSKVLIESQSTDGYWTPQWSQGHKVSDHDKAALSRRILATGHHLEWLALAPNETHPPREVIVRASQWLIRTLLELDEKAIQASYGPYSHAARALCLWRGHEPYDFWKSHQQNDVAD